MQTSTTTEEAHCNTPTRQQTPDPVATFGPEILATSYPLAQLPNGQVKHWLDSGNAVYAIDARKTRLDQLLLLRRRRVTNGGRIAKKIRRDLDAKTTTLRPDGRDMATEYKVTATKKPETIFETGKGIHSGSNPACSIVRGLC
jgi:hypothetical protein